MIDPRGEGPGVLLPRFARRVALLEQLVAATVRQENPEVQVVRMFTPAHGADNPDSNHYVTSTRSRVGFALITPGGSGGGFGGWQLFVGAERFFSFAFQNQGETTMFPFPFVIDAGVEVFNKMATPSVASECWWHFYGWPE